MRLCNKDKRRICTEKGEDVSTIKRGEVYKFIKKQLRKRYIRPSKSPQIAPVFFVKKKDSKKRMVQN